MHCLNCQHCKNETCEIEPIYASGYLRNCSHLGNGEPIIIPGGANYQIMTEIISLPGRLERIEVTPWKRPGELGWYASLMIGYEGKGLVVKSTFAETLPIGAIWFGWQYARSKAAQINHKGLLKLLPLIDLRIRFDYSVLEYRAIRKPDTVLVSVEKPEKKKISFVPANEENLQEVAIPDNEGKDQLDLFAC